MPTLFIRTILIYAVMFALIRFMGKRQISDMQPFDLTVTLLIANLASLPMGDPGTPLLYGVIPITALFILHRLVAFFSLRSEKVRTLVCGRALIVINKGRVEEEVMRAANYSLTDLIEQLRLKNIFSIADVEYAILETNGSLSVIPKAASRQPTNAELSVKAKEERPALELITDGRLHRDALEAAGMKEKELAMKLRSRGVNGVKACFIASMDGTGGLFIQKKTEKKGKKHGGEQ